MNNRVEEMEEKLEKQQYFVVLVMKLIKVQSLPFT